MLHNLHSIVQGIPNLPLPKKAICESINCTGCLVGEMTRSPFNHKIEGAFRHIQRIHVDLVGPYSVESIDTKKKYAMTITDKFTRYRFTYFLRKKDDALGSLKTYRAMAETHFCEKGYKVTAMRCDEGGEFISKPSNAWRAKHRIRLEDTPARTPQGDGISETTNKIIVSKANAMMQTAKAKVLLGDGC